MAILDQEFLFKVIDSYKLLHQNSLIILIDTSKNIVFASDRMIEVFNLDKDNILNKNYLTSGIVPEEIIELMGNSVGKVILDKKEQKSLFINVELRNNISQILICMKLPIIHPENGGVAGVCIEFREIETSLYFQNFQKILSIITPSAHIGDFRGNDKLLSHREHEIAFLLFHCKTSNEIAEIISKFNKKSVTPKTIRNIIRQQLYLKLGVWQHDQLMEKLHGLGYHRRIPRSLLSNQFINLSDFMDTL